MLNRAALSTLDSIEEFIELAYKEEWTDGLPVYPATPKLLDEMLGYLGRDPQEIIGVVHPGDGEATVEKIAINCIMAGCRPEYAPVVIAAVEAMTDPSFMLSPLQSTGSPALLCMVSGPAVKQLGFNTREWVFGGNGGRANATIGRALRLVHWNIGRARAGALMKGTMGHPAAWSYCIGEESELNPWPPFTTDLGLAADVSAVTLFKAGTHLPVWSASELVDISQSISLLADELGALRPVPDYMRGQRNIILVINPSYAQLLAKAGITKQEFKQALAKQAYSWASPVDFVSGQYLKTDIEQAPEGPANPLRLPVIPEVNDLIVVVSGAPGAARSQCTAIAGFSHVGKGFISKPVHFPKGASHASSL